jgi:hypothetical protein
MKLTALLSLAWALVARENLPSMAIGQINGPASTPQCIFNVFHHGATAYRDLTFPFITLRVGPSGEGPFGTGAYQAALSNTTEIETTRHLTSNGALCAAREPF